MVGEELLFQILVVTIVAIIATVGVYGIVALLVRMDDFGIWLVQKNSNTKGFLYTLGNLLIRALPWVIKSLSVIGTIALLLVAGGIFVHNIDLLHHVLKSWPSILRDFVVGLAVGFIALLLFKAVKGLVNLVKK